MRPRSTLLFAIALAAIAFLPARADAQRAGGKSADTWELEIPLEEGFRRVRPPVEEEEGAEPARGGLSDERRAGEDLEEPSRQDRDARRNVFERYADEFAEDEEEVEPPPGTFHDRRSPAADSQEPVTPPSRREPQQETAAEPEDELSEDPVEGDEESEDEEPAIPSLAARLRHPSAGVEQIHRLWRARRDGLLALDTAAVDAATSNLLELRAELGIESLPGMAVAVVREGAAHLDRKDAADARKSADLAVDLAPDMAAAHWFRARALLAEDLRQVGASVGAVLSALKAEITGVPARRLLLANLAVIVFMGMLVAGLIFLATLTTRTLRQYIHDFHHLFPKGAARLQTGVLAVAILVAPILLQAGLALAIVVLAAAAWFHSTMKERLVLALTLALVSASPHLAAFFSDLAAFWDTPAEQVWRLEKTDGAGAAPAIEARADAGSAAWQELFALARYHKRAGRLERAVARYEEAAQAAPREALIHHNLGVALYAMNDLPGARDAFRKASELDPARAGTWHNLSKVYFRLGEHVPGQEARRRAVEMDADLLEEYPDPEDRLNLALVEGGLSAGQILSLAKRESDEKSAAAEQVKIRLAGLVPAKTAPWLPLAVVPLLFLSSLLVSRRRPSTPCVKCGRSVCPRCDPEVAGGKLCGQCVNVFQKRGAVSQRARLVKEAGIRRHQSRREGLARTLSFILPGGGHLLLDRPVQAAILLFVFATGCLGLVFWFGPIPAPWAPSAGPGVLRLIPPGLAVAATWLIANWMLWRRGR